MSTTTPGGQNPNLPEHYVPLTHSEHTHPAGNVQLGAADTGQLITATLILRRNPGGEPMKGLDYFQHTPLSLIRPIAHKDFAAAHQLEVIESSAARRSVVVRGTVDQVNKAFAIELHQYRSPLGKYHGHE